MSQIDIVVSADLQEAFNLPACADISLPKPSPLKIHLPTGGTLSAISDISKGIPTDCAMTFSLMIQIAPFLAGLECLLKVLKLLKPLIDVVNGLPVPPVKAIQEFAKAAVELTPCLLVPTPLSLAPFIKDLLCMILKALKCFLSQMKSLLAILGPLQLQITAASASGNSDVLATLQCAQENAQTQAQHLMSSIEPISVILDLAGTIFSIAGIAPIKLPSLGSNADVSSLRSAVKSVQEVVAVIQIAADALGGCDA
jgi:hypothetical protein